MSTGACRSFYRFGLQEYRNTRTGSQYCVNHDISCVCQYHVGHYQSRRYDWHARRLGSLSLYFLWEMYRKSRNLLFASMRETHRSNKCLCFDNDVRRVFETAKENYFVCICNNFYFPVQAGLCWRADIVSDKEVNERGRQRNCKAECCRHMPVMAK